MARTAWEKKKKRPHAKLAVRQLLPELLCGHELCLGDAFPSRLISPYRIFRELSQKARIVDGTQPHSGGRPLLESGHRLDFSSLQRLVMSTVASIVILAMQGSTAREHTMPFIHLAFY